LAGTAVKASETDAQPDAAGSVLWGLGNFPNKQGFRVTKALLATIVLVLKGSQPVSYTDAQT